jgi:hypothetical protein
MQRLPCVELCRFRASSKACSRSALPAEQSANLFCDFTHTGGFRSGRSQSAR